MGREKQIIKSGIGRCVRQFSKGLKEASIAGFASAASVPKLPTQGLRLPEGYGHYATFVDAESGYTFDLSAQGYNGTSQVILLDQEISKMPSLPETSGPWFTPLHDSSDLEAFARRDICVRLATCAGQAADGVITGSIFIANTVGNRCNSIGNSVYNYFTANDYANLNNEPLGFVTGILVNIASTPIGEAILSSKHAKAEGGEDSCSVTEREDLSVDFASAVRQFCQAMQAAQSTNTEKCFQAGALSNDVSDMRGDNSVTRAFIAAQAGNFGPVCCQHDIVWKRLNRYINGVF